MQGDSNETNGIEKIEKRHPSVAMPEPKDQGRDSHEAPRGTMRQTPQQPVGNAGQVLFGSVPSYQALKSYLSSGGRGI